jgi:uncharacterized membrane protein YqiK
MRQDTKCRKRQKMKPFEKAMNEYNKKIKQARENNIRLNMSTNIEEHKLEEKLYSVQERVKKEGIRDV